MNVPMHFISAMLVYNMDICAFVEIHMENMIWLQIQSVTIYAQAIIVSVVEDYGEMLFIQPVRNFSLS